MSSSKSRLEPIAHLDEQRKTTPRPHPGGGSKSRVQDDSTRHIAEKPYPCLEPGCPKSYTDARGLRRHFDAHHAPTPSAAAPKKPSNAFMLFRSELYRRLQERGEDFGSPTISKVAGKVWKDLPEEQKKVYKDKAEEVNAKHKEKYPDYKPTITKRTRTPKRTQEEIQAIRAHMLATVPNPTIAWDDALQPLRQEWHHSFQDSGMYNASASSSDHSSRATPTNPYYASTPSTYQNAPF